MPSIQAIVERQLRRWELERDARAAEPGPQEPRTPPQPVITVSRQRGSGGSRVAEIVARRLDYTLLHRDVIDRICSSSGIRRSIIESLDEHAKSQVASWCEAIVQQRYADSSDYVRFLLETIRSVAELGGVVVVGRGANCVVGFDRGLHVRVVAPREYRIERLVDHERLSPRAAAREVADRDRERAAFVRKVFGADVSDPTGYDLVVNTAAMGFEEAATLVETAAREKFEWLRHAARPRAPLSY